jgi:hypothetical protein
VNVLENRGSVLSYDMPLHVVSTVLAGTTYYAPINFNGIDEISFRVDGRGDVNDVTTVSFYLIVGAINDPPAIFSSGGVDLDENSWRALQIQINDEDVDLDASSAIFSVAVRAEACSVECLEPFSEGIAHTTTNASDVVLKGMLKYINSAFIGNKVVYRPPLNWYGADHITVIVDDMCHSGKGKGHVIAQTILIEVHQVDDLPVIKGPRQAVKVLEGGKATVTGVSVSDSDLPEGGTIAVSIGCLHGDVMLRLKDALPMDVSFSKGAAQSLESRHSFRASLLATNMLLHNLEYQPAKYFNGKDHVTIFVQNGCAADDLMVVSCCCNTTECHFQNTCARFRSQ